MVIKAVDLMAVSNLKSAGSDVIKGGGPSGGFKINSNLLKSTFPIRQLILCI